MKLENELEVRPFVLSVIVINCIILHYFQMFLLVG